jgi:predicted metal-dependent phosphoesterase TrpH
MAKKKRIGLSPESHERHERTKRLLLERIAYHEAKLEEARTGVPVEPKIRVPTSEEVRAQMIARLAGTPEAIASNAEIQQRLLERLAYHEAKLEEARTGVPVEPKIRIPTSEEVRAQLVARLTQVDPDFRA